MANTYTQIHIHAVFAIQNRISLINKDWTKGLYKFHKTKEDASLRDANDLATDFSTERGIPNGMQIKKRQKNTQNIQ